MRGETSSFCLEARVVGGDAPFPWVGAVGLAFLLGREAPNHLPSPQSCGGVVVDGMSAEVRQRRSHQIPDDQGERGGLAGLQASLSAGDCDPAGGLMLTNVCGHRVSVHLKSLSVQSRIKRQAGQRKGSGLCTPLSRRSMFFISTTTPPPLCVPTFESRRSRLRLTSPVALAYRRAPLHLGAALVLR